MPRDDPKAAMRSRRGCPLAALERFRGSDGDECRRIIKGGRPGASNRFRVVPSVEGSMTVVGSRAGVPARRRAVLTCVRWGVSRSGWRPSSRVRNLEGEERAVRSGRRSGSHRRIGFTTRAIGRLRRFWRPRRGALHSGVPRGGRRGSVPRCRSFPVEHSSAERARLARGNRKVGPAPPHPSPPCSRQGARRRSPFVRNLCTVTPFGGEGPQKRRPV
jgi:hypothetical protein